MSLFPSATSGNSYTSAKVRPQRILTPVCGNELVVGESSTDFPTILGLWCAESKRSKIILKYSECRGTLRVSFPDSIPGLTETIPGNWTFVARRLARQFQNIAAGNKVSGKYTLTHSD